MTSSSTPEECSHQKLLPLMVNDNCTASGHKCTPTRNMPPPSLSSSPAIHHHCPRMAQNLHRKYLGAKLKPTILSFYRFCCSATKSSFGTLLLVVLLQILSFATQSHCEITISQLLVPEYVENGTTSQQQAVILDCVYAFDEEDRDSLVVKWFLNEDPTPIYQWVPEMGTRVHSDRLQGKVQQNFAVTRDPFTRYRALRLIEPTTDLSGRYTCQVMSMFGHATKEKNMIVYAPPKSVNFKFKKTLLRDNAAEPGTSLAQHSSSASSVMPYSSSGLGQRLRASQQQYPPVPNFHENPHLEVPNPLGSSSRNPPPIAGQRQAAQYQQQVPVRSTPGAILRCDVDMVYPIPSVTIYRVNLDGSDPRNLPLVIDSRPAGPINSYNISVLAQVRDAELLSDPLVGTGAGRPPYSGYNPSILHPAPSRAMLNSDMRNLATASGGGSNTRLPQFGGVSDQNHPNFYINQQQQQQQSSNQNFARKRGEPQSIFECLVVWGSPTVKYERKRRLAYHIAELTDPIQSSTTTAGSASLHPSQTQHHLIMCFILLLTSIASIISHCSSATLFITSSPTRRSQQRVT